MSARRGRWPVQAESLPTFLCTSGCRTWARHKSCRTSATQRERERWRQSRPRRSERSVARRRFLGLTMSFLIRTFFPQVPHSYHTTGGGGNTGAASACASIPSGSPNRFFSSSSAPPMVPSVSSAAPPRRLLLAPPRRKNGPQFALHFGKERYIFESHVFCFP